MNDNIHNHSSQYKYACYFFLIPFTSQTSDLQTLVSNQVMCMQTNMGSSVYQTSRLQFPGSKNIMSFLGNYSKLQFANLKVVITVLHENYNSSVLCMQLYFEKTGSACVISLRLVHIALISAPRAHLVRTVSASLWDHLYITIAIYDAHEDVSMCSNSFRLL